MNHSQCDGCQSRLPKQHGMHYAEQELFMCTAKRYRLELEPRSSDTWHKPAVRKASEAPFVVGGDR